MMEVYLLKANGYNAVVLTDGKTAKVQHTDERGRIYGIDLYQTDTNGLLDTYKIVSDLDDYFIILENSGDMESYDLIWSDNQLEEDEAGELLRGSNPEITLYHVGEYSPLKYLIRDFDEGDPESRFYVNEIEDAKSYFSDLLDFCDDEEKKKEYSESKTLEELADVLNHIDDFSYSVKRP